MLEVHTTYSSNAVSLQGHMVLALAATTCLHAKAQASGGVQRQLQAAAAALAGELLAVEAGLRALADGRPLEAPSEQGTLATHVLRVCALFMMHTGICLACLQR